MIRSAARVILAADSTKFRHTAMAVVASAADVDMIITDADAPPDSVESLRAAGLEVRCV
jgi:DeoR/GlpR family transcriptional regulator of sugar metabolism